MTLIQEFREYQAHQSLIESVDQLDAMLDESIMHKVEDGALAAYDAISDFLYKIKADKAFDHVEAKVIGPIVDMIDDIQSDLQKYKEIKRQQRNPAWKDDDYSGNSKLYDGIEGMKKKVAKLKALLHKK